MNSHKTHVATNHRANSGLGRARPCRRVGIAPCKCSLILALLPAFFLAGASMATGQSETVLYTFTGHADGATPNAPLLRDDDGNLYGTATFGGNLNDCDDQGCGTVFKLSKNGELTALYAFTGGKDGSLPNGPLVRDAEGNLYGTTQEGGAHGWGVVFKVTPSSKETVLYSFGSQAEDGALPMAGLVRDSAGNLYGTTFAGGGNCPGYGCGTVYEVTPSGAEKILWRFGHLTNDGLNPYYTTLIRDKQGNLYGTTHYGGANPGPDGTGLGTVFKVTSSGEEKVLYSFTGGTDGAFPYAGLAQDAKGNLYGTTGGSVFEITTSGKEKTIYDFQGSSGDGSDSTANLLRDANGDLNGTTFQGGSYDGGTVFRVTSSGKETMLYSFFTTASGLEATDGQWPTGGVIQDAEGNLYGATTYGGNYDSAYMCYSEGCGVLFELTP
jgi:uncharacterized repeat protein (TIGR03803 family)